MKIISSYDVKLTTENYKVFDATSKVVTDAVKYFLNIFEKEWNNMNYALDDVTSQTAMRFIEALTHKTKSNQHPKYDFDSKFYKIPSGIRRYCINRAFGMISSYKSNLENWNKYKTGKRPSFPKVRHEFPCFYKQERNIIDKYHLKLKVYNGSDWVWIVVKLRKSDVDYLSKFETMSSPIMEKRYKRYYLRYAVEETVTLNKTDIKNQRILAVDLGLNNAATCSVMLSDGTVLERKFLKLTREKDQMEHVLNKIKKSQQHGSVKISRRWNKVKGLNKNIAAKTANFIIETAIKYDVDVIVFEHLDLAGKKGKYKSKRQLLHLWKAKDVQRMVEHKAHKNKIRVSHVNSWKTSRLAYDGSGDVSRGKFTVNGIEKYNYSICVFSNGKQYNCDLNASYSIGARYFIRELLKSVPEMERLAVLAKVPELATRSRCTLASLISLNAVLQSP